ncbi:hypothetical protein [Mucilaginibacter celer]|uniref:Uncharacterized protein n=1 Tax=Mucilaginibacter celer TaxID=2305508 RepID=A0A494VH01_9SPHI|nr:hypothetical protein [Mucilaginibacter celer]AYL93886.1 hypothetical protein HYN43_000605 [Mucilaginibacter celer]
MIRIIMTPDKNCLTIKLPDSLVGKTIEVIAFEIDQIEETIIADQKKKRIEDINKALNKHRVDLTGFKFDRDEANNYNRL